MGLMALYKYFNLLFYLYKSQYIARQALITLINTPWQTTTLASCLDILELLDSLLMTLINW